MTEMAGVMIKSGRAVYRSGQPMNELHLITEGEVTVQYPGGKYRLTKGDVIGISEICSEVHFLDYTTAADTTLIAYPFANIDELDTLLARQGNLSKFFVLSLFKQINAVLSYCSVSGLSCSSMYKNLLDDYKKYTELCKVYRIDVKTPDGWDNLTAYLGEEAADLWLASYYMGLTRVLSAEPGNSVINEPAIASGFLRKGSLDFRRAYTMLDDQNRYLLGIYDFYFNESGNDLLNYFVSLYYKVGQDAKELDGISSDINRMFQMFDEKPGEKTAVLEQRVETFKGNLASGQVPETKQDEAELKLVMAELTGSLATILDYACMDVNQDESFRSHIQSYKAAADKFSADDDMVRLRAAITREFYELYTAVYKQTLRGAPIPLPVRMFLYFGYVDEELAGAANAAALLKICESMSDHGNQGVYTFFDWLNAIYRGKKEPSRNEFDEDYTDYINNLKKNGNFTAEQRRAMENDRMAKVDYELNNLFITGNKITYGRIATYCPVFVAENVLKDLNASYVTAGAINKTIDMIRKIDYTAFYRESYDMENMDVLAKETVHFEFLPDVILMPNVGVRGVMWQEIEGKKRSTPGRMLLSLFHMEDLNLSMTRMTGEFRWEMCKRVQGARWNDLSELSLTSEYYDYIQFYRKNHELSAEAKEKVRSGLQRAKNSFKEMFVREYMIWVLYEGTGSPRLNKVARKIFFTYCTFPKEIIETLRQNPLYSELITKYDIQTSQKLHRLDGLIKKMRNCGQRVPESLEREVEYVAGTIK